MDEKDLEHFSDIMGGLAENFSAILSQSGLKIRFKALMSLTIEEVEAAAMTILAQRKYTSMPTVAEFLQASGRGVASIEDQALSEWHNKVVPAMGHHGGYESVVFDDPVTMAVIDRFGGWVKLCEASYDELVWIQKDFIKAYKAFHAEGIKKTGYLPGRTETDNLNNGYSHKEGPALIGDQAKARVILEHYEPNLIENMGTLKNMDAA